MDADLGRGEPRMASGVRPGILPMTLRHPLENSHSKHLPTRDIADMPHSNESLRSLLSFLILPRNIPIKIEQSEINQKSQR